MVQARTDAEGGEVTPAQMWEAFPAEYLAPGRVALLDQYTSSAVDAKDALTVEVSVDGVGRQIEGAGNGPISAFCDALGSIGVEVRVLDYAEHAHVGGQRRPGRRLRRVRGRRARSGGASASTPTR